MTPFLSPASFSRSAGLLALLAASLLLLNPQTTDAQTWRRTARFATPVANGPFHTFLDTLVHVVERTERRVWRSPSQEERLPVSALQEQLIEEHGMGVTGANQLLISYSFEIGDRGRLERDIDGLYFLFRPKPSRPDIPVLYLDAQQEWVQDLMRRKGTLPPTNESGLVPFRQHLQFGHVAQMDAAQVVQIGNEPVRDGFAGKKEALFQRILRLATTV